MYLGKPPIDRHGLAVRLPTRALIELAADEPDGSPAAAVCLWLAQHIRRQDAEANPAVHQRDQGRGC
jgi:hypothetical protein